MTAPSDAESLSDRYQRIHGLIRYYARRSATWLSLSVEDLVQEASLEFARHPDKPIRFCVSRAARELIRLKPKSGPQTSLDGGIAGELAGDGPEPHESLERRELVEQAVDLVRTADRELLIEYFGLDGSGGRTPHEMAERRGVKHQSILRAINQALRILRERMDETGPIEPEEDRLAMPINSSCRVQLLA